MRERAVVVAALLCLVSAGCGYHTAGHAAQLPDNVKTIAIPAFGNETQTYKINQTSDAADATLRGSVISTYSAPLTYDSQTGRASSVLVTVNMKVALTDKQGKVLYENPSYIFRQQYQVSSDLTSFFEEDTPALQRLSQEFARTLVSNILEGF